MLNISIEIATEVAAISNRCDFKSLAGWILNRLRFRHLEQAPEEPEALTSVQKVSEHCGKSLGRGNLKRYPEIGDRPNKVLLNPPKGSIEPLKRPLLAPKKVLQNPSERVFRTTEKVLSNRSHRTPPPPFQVTLITFPTGESQVSRKASGETAGSASDL